MSDTTTKPPLPPDCIAAINGNYIMKDAHGTFYLIAVGTGAWAFGLSEQHAMSNAINVPVPGYEGQREYAKKPTNPL